MDTETKVNQAIVINGKSYSIIERQGVGFDAERVVVETKSGARKTAMFYHGEFDVWETKPRASNKFSRVNMRK